jgi:hypothetical protein
VAINTREVMPCLAQSLLKIQRRNSEDAPSNREKAETLKGSRNQATLLAEALLDGEAETLTRTMIEKASDGDTTVLFGTTSASQPCDPHHLRFAQPRAMGLKVSDEFTVPLCRGHHRQLNQAGNEEAWWENLRINALQDRPRRLGANPSRVGSSQHPMMACVPVGKPHHWALPLAGEGSSALFPQTHHDVRWLA